MKSSGACSTNGMHEAGSQAHSCGHDLNNLQTEADEALSRPLAYLAASDAALLHTLSFSLSPLTPAKTVATTRHQIK